MRAGDQVRVLAAGGPVLPDRLLGDHLFICSAILAGPQAGAPEGSTVRRRQAHLEATGSYPAQRAHGSHEIGEGGAGA
jgi:hypothetical protein